MSRVSLYDVVDETDETVTIGSSSALVTGSVTLSLTDNDAAPTGITLSASPTAVDEGDGATTITVTTAVAGGTTYAVAKSLPMTVTGSGNADAVDFSPVSDFDIALPAEAASAPGTFELSPLDDSDAETDETVTVSSSSTLVTNTVAITIRDDDASPADITLGVNPATASEDGGTATITVTATVGGGNTYSTVQVLPIAVTGSGIASAVDFAAVPSFSITLAAGASSASATFSVTPHDQ